jgi:hypothetical protein
MEIISEKQVMVVIPDDRKNIIKFSFFEDPPMSPIVPLIIHKKWIISYMRKHAQKYWAPFLVASLGSDKYIPNEGEFLEYKEYLENELPEMYNFSGIVIPGWITLNQLTSATKSDAQLYISELDWCNKEIMNCLFGSMQQRDASSREGKAAVGETSKWSVGMFNKSRAEFMRGLQNICAFNLIGDEDPDDFDVQMTPVSQDKLIDIAASTERIASLDQFSGEELRRMASNAFPWIDPKAKVDVAESRDIKLAKMGAAQKKEAGANKPAGSQREPTTRPSAARTG